MQLVPHVLCRSQSQSRLALYDPGLLHSRGPQSPAKGRAPVSAPLLAPSGKATGLSSALSQGQGKVRNTPQVQPGQGLCGAEVPGVVDAIQASPVSAAKKMLAGQIETCALIYLCVCERGCVCACVEQTSPGPQCWAAVLVLCSSSQPMQAPSLAGGSAPGHPGWHGVSLWYDADTLVCRGRGGGATKRSSSLQRQEEDGHGPPELWAGLPGGSTARHHHHCDGKEKGDRPGLWSAQQGQGGLFLCPLSVLTDTLVRHEVVCSACWVQILALWLTK